MGSFQSKRQRSLEIAAKARQKAEHDRLIKDIERKHDETLRKQQDKFDLLIRNLNEERLKDD